MINNHQALELRHVHRGVSSVSENPHWIRVIGASLSKPHIDHDNVPRMRNNGMSAVSTCMYLCLYHLPRVCCTLVPEIRVCPKILHVFRYIDMLMCVIYNCTRLKSHEQLKLLVSAVNNVDEDR